MTAVEEGTFRRRENTQRQEEATGLRVTGRDFIMQLRGEEALTRSRSYHAICGRGRRSTWSGNS